MEVLHILPEPATGARTGHALHSLCPYCVHWQHAGSYALYMVCPAVGLLCSGGAPPQDQQVSLAAALQRSCVAFCTVCHAATAAAGPSLKTSLGKLAHDVITPCLALVKDMVSAQIQTQLGVLAPCRSANAPRQHHQVAPVIILRVNWQQHFLKHAHRCTECSALSNMHLACKAPVMHAPEIQPA
jgi:hypothetical protein